MFRLDLSMTNHITIVKFDLYVLHFSLKLGLILQLCRCRLEFSRGGSGKVIDIDFSKNTTAQNSIVIYR